MNDSVDIAGLAAVLDRNVDTELRKERDPALDVAIVDRNENSIIVVATGNLVASVGPDVCLVDLSNC